MFIIFTLLLLIAWFWWDERGAAEMATKAVRRHCQKVGVSFLNDTVAWKKIRLKRNKLGRVTIQRTYFFDFASDMRQQYQGEIIMLGRQVESIHLDVFRIE